jgi:hypothetical protein
VRIANAATTISAKFAARSQRFCKVILPLSAQNFDLPLAQELEKSSVLRVV